MLDEQTPAETGTEASSNPAASAQPEPASEEAADDTSETGAEPATAPPARKRAPRKTAAKKAAAPTPEASESTQSTAVTEPTGSAGDAAEAPTAPARKRAPRKTAAKKSAAAKTEATGGAAPAEAPAEPTTPPAESVAPVKKTAKRTTKKAASRPATKRVAADASQLGLAGDEAALAAQPAPTPSEGTPTEEPPTDVLPPEGGPAEGPPAEGPPAEGPPAEGPPAEGPPAEAASIEPAVPEIEPDEGTAAKVPTAVAPLFQPPDPTAARPARKRTTKKKAAPPEEGDDQASQPTGDELPLAAQGAPGKDVTDRDEVVEEATSREPAEAEDTGADGAQTAEADEEGEGGARRRRRRGGRRRRKPSGENGDGADTDEADEDSAEVAQPDRPDRPDQEPGEAAAAGETDFEGGTSSRRRRRRRRSGEGDDDTSEDEATVTRVRKPRNAEDEITGFTGSTRLEAKKQRRREGREAGRRRAPIISEAEFLARREAVDRKMVIRQRGDLTQIAVLEDKVLVEHYVARESQTSLIGNVYLGRVQNVLPSMEAAFIDIGKGRNAVLYAGEVNWDSLGAKDGKQRKIEQVLKSGQPVLVQVTKDPIGHKGARLTSQISLPGRFLVYVPDGNTSGISRKLPDIERNRLKTLLKEIVPDTAGVIVRTAAEGASESELTRDVERLKALWDDISAKVENGNAPQLLYGEPDLTLKVVRDLFTEDIGRLVVSGDEAWAMVQQYVEHVAPDLVERLERHNDQDGDAFAEYRIDEQIAKGLDRKVWLPSGGSLVIDRTEAMTVVDVNTGKFTGSGGNLEETVTKNNLEAAEEIVRQLRLRDIGGIIVVDFIDMVLESNRDLVLRRLIECLGRDRTRHQVAEVTSLGLVQMTRKRIGTGLLEAFSEGCEACQGRGVIVHQEPIDSRRKQPQNDDDSRRGGGRRNRGRGKGFDENGGKDSGRGSDHESKDSGRPPTPAEFAAMVRHEPAHAHGEVPETVLDAVPDDLPEALPGGLSDGTPSQRSLTVDALAASDEEPGPVENVPVERGVPAEADAGSEPAEEATSTAEPLVPGQPETPPVPPAPRIVTSVRRVGARRAAGPPVVRADPAAVDTPPQGDPPPPTDGHAESHSAQNGAVESPEPVHVPVKKKGTRKR